MFIPADTPALNAFFIVSFPKFDNIFDCSLLHFRKPIRLVVANKKQIVDTANLLSNYPIEAHFHYFVNDEHRPGQYVSVKRVPENIAIAGRRLPFL